MLRPITSMAAVWQDVRDAVRALLRFRAFTVACVATLGLATGATTAIFTVVHSVILRPLPFPDSERLIQLFATPAERGEAISLSDVRAFRTQSTSLEALAGYGVSARYLRGSAEPERVMAVVAEAPLFEVLGVGPRAGRTFRTDDPANVGIVSQAFALRRFPTEEAAIGATLVLDEEPVTIIGVMPASFQFPYSSASTLRGVASETRTDLWLPLYPVGQPPRGRASVVARLKPDVSLERASSELAVIAARLAPANPAPETSGRGVRVETLSDAVVPATLRRSLFLLLAAAAVVLALACANVANLSLVHTSRRRREVAVRVAMGASPARIVRQFLTESLLLSAAGGAVGLWLAVLGTDRLMDFVAAQMPRAREVSVDWPVFLFLLAVGASTGVAFGLAPALIARKVDPQSVLKESGSHGTAGIAQRRLRDALVVVEVALAFLLAVGGAVLIRELARLQQVDAGLSSTNAITLHLGHRTTARSDVRQFADIANRVMQLPGVRAAGFTQMLPLQHWGWQSVSSDFRLKGRPSPTPVFPIEMRYVTPGYFDALGMTITSGRGFSGADNREAPPVILINETLARRYFQDDDPVGEQTSRGTIVGVVRDVRQVHLDQPALPEIYFPASQNWSQVSELGMTLVVRTHGRPEALANAIQSAIREVNPNLAIFSVRTLDDVVADSLSSFTLYLQLIAAFAALALLLATTGTYAVMSYAAATRTREFAIRLAIGARKGGVIRLVLGRAAGLTALGLLIGFLAARVASPLLRDLPVSVRPPDVATLAPVALLIAAAGMLAAFLPAYRGAGTNLTTTLRND